MRQRCCSVGSLPSSIVSSIPRNLVIAVTLVASLASVSRAKDTSLTAIELYDAPSGVAYVQLADVLINGKVEVRACGEAQKIDRGSYGKLGKVSLVGATSLERGSDGALVLVKEAGPICIVPTNLKFEKKDGALTRSELADRAILQGRVVSSSIPAVDTPPRLKPGVKVVFVSSPDTELAEFLRADRAHSIGGWQDYLGRYANAVHAGQARQTLANLLTQDAANGLAAYRKSLAEGHPSYGELKKAQVRAEEARRLVPALATAGSLRDEVHGELSALTDKAQAEFQEYKKALAGRTSGYIHLTNSQKLAEEILDIDSALEQVQTLNSNINNEIRAIDSSIRSAESLVSSQHFDQALNAVSAYRGFADEQSRIAAIVKSAYQFHLERGKSFEASSKWKEAVQEYQQACGIDKTDECSSLLKRSKAGLNKFTNEAAARAAFEQSEEYEQQRQYIEAYEVLAFLPDAQRALVADRIESLKAPYVKSAAAKAKELQLAHTPIQGRADEIAIQRAYEYLQRASSLQKEDQNLNLRLDLLSSTISDYYLQQAKKYLEKPLGSGMGVAWCYLDEAQQYKPNRDDVRGERTKSSAVHQIRTKLSIRVVFRDQTSRRDSPLFAEQLSDAIATGLETSGLPVKVIRANDPNAVEPNFQLIGDVLQHRATLSPSIEPKESKYRAGEREVPNEEWNRANRESETASFDLQRAQKSLEAAQAHKKKKEIDAATSAMQDAEKRVQQAHQKLDSISKTLPTDIIKSYTYIKKTYDLAASVEIAARMVDSSGNVVDNIAPIARPAHKTFVVLENVKPEDTEGVKPEGAPPDELQYLTDVEIDARDTLIKAVREKVENLPKQILEQARRRASDGDVDGAAEAYILYLNSSPEAQTPNRQEAMKFLLDQFNIRKVPSTGS